MKKVPLTQQEKDRIAEIQKIRGEMEMLKLEYDKKTSDFWYDFQKRQGGGAFILTIPTGIVWKKSPEEVVKEQQLSNKSKN